MIKRKRRILGGDPLPLSQNINLNVCSNQHQNICRPTRRFCQNIAIKTLIKIIIIILITLIKSTNI